MSLPFRITLLQLKPDLSGLGTATDSHDIAHQSAEDIVRLAAKLQLVDLSTRPGAEPALIVRRGERGWRIVVRAGKLRVHQSTSALDDYVTVETPEGLANLPQFRTGTNSAEPIRMGTPGEAPKWKGLRLAFEVTGLLLVAVALMAVGIWFGLPRKKLSAPPPDVRIVNSPAEKQAVISALAGTYATGKAKPGEKVLIIGDDGRATIGRIGRDGKLIMPPDQEGATRPARKDNYAALVTPFGTVYATEETPNAIKVGDFRWSRTSVQ